MSAVSAERLAKIFVEVADTMVDEFDLIAFMQMLADGMPAWRLVRAPEWQ